jgi:hypothetical protein
MLKHPSGEEKGPPSGVQDFRVQRREHRARAQSVAEGPSPHRSLQRATRPASGPTTTNGTLAGAIGDRLVGPQMAARNGFLSVADHILRPPLGRWCDATCPGAFESIRTHGNLSDARNRGFQGAQ